MLLGPPKSRAGRRVVGIPDSIIPALRARLAAFTGAEPGWLMFPGAKGGPLRRVNFNKMSGWPDAVRTIGAAGLHFHDLRHTGNQFQQRRGAEEPYGADGHDSARAALIYQHAARGADKRITDAIDMHVQVEQANDDDDGQPVGSRPSANGPLMARTVGYGPRLVRPGLGGSPLTWGFAPERVTGIEPALSAWEADVLPLNYTRAPALFRWGTGMYCVRPDIVPDPIGCQGAPLRS